MDQLEAKVVMLSRQEMASLSQALEMTADMIEGSFDEDTEPASPLVLRAVALRGGSPSCPGSDPTIPATIWLTVHEDEIPHVTYVLASFMDAHSEYTPAGVKIADLKAVITQI
jgi:hypothetical protein